VIAERNLRLAPDVLGRGRERRARRLLVHVEGEARGELTFDLYVDDVEALLLVDERKRRLQLGGVLPLQRQFHAAVHAEQRLAPIRDRRLRVAGDEQEHTREIGWLGLGGAGHAGLLRRGPGLSTCLEDRQPPCLGTTHGRWQAGRASRKVRPS
jgi:hypothetical protein